MKFVDRIKNTGGVYKIKNLINGKIYIGSSVNFNARYNEHLRDLRKNKHHSIYLQRSWEKYGEENFQFKIIEFVDKNLYKNRLELRDILIKREQHWIDNLCPEYNISPTAGSCLGVKHTEETKKKISKATKGSNNPMYGRKGELAPNYGKITSEETKHKIALTKIGDKNYQFGRKGELSTNYGKVFSEESRKKMSNSQKGRIITDEHRIKLSEASIGSKNHKSKAVICIETGMVYGSGCEASRVTGIDQSSINMCCNKKRDTAGGYHWEFYIKENKEAI